MLNLTGKIVRDRNEYFISGDYYDFYPARWLERPGYVIILLADPDDYDSINFLLSR